MGMQFFFKLSQHSFEGVKYLTQYDKISSLSICIITGDSLHKLTELHTT